MASSPPVPDGDTGRRALSALMRERNVLAALEVFNRELGDIFRITLPGFKPVTLAGPEANRFVLTTARDRLSWRAEGDPVVKLLRHGLLIEDGEQHDSLRALIMPALQSSRLPSYVEGMVHYTDVISAGWSDGLPRDMLVEMRRVALLSVVGTLFKTDLSPDLDRLWPAILRTLAFISPGLWLIWSGAPRLGYDKAQRDLDDYLYGLIAARRRAGGGPDDLLGALITAPGMNDDLIRDQLLTILIAGHDTSTALLAWAIYLLASHPDVARHARSEVDAVLGGRPPTAEQAGQLHYLGRVIKESLRLYPPIHLGTRVAMQDLEFRGCQIPAGTRVVYSIYLTHRQPEYWPDPERFDPERFTVEQSRARPPFTFVPFGGGPRNCVGAAFAHLEAKIVLARMLQQFEWRLVGNVHPHMGATLEPRPGVNVVVSRRDS